MNDNKALNELGPMTGSRQSAKAALMHRVERLRHEAHALEALAYQVDSLTSEAEAALWELVVSRR